MALDASPPFDRSGGQVGLVGQGEDAHLPVLVGQVNVMRVPGSLVAVSTRSVTTVSTAPAAPRAPVRHLSSFPVSADRAGSPPVAWRGLHRAGQLLSDLEGLSSADADDAVRRTRILRSGLALTATPQKVQF